MCARDTIQFVMFTVWMFTFVAASRGHVCNSTAVLFCQNTAFAGAFFSKYTFSTNNAVVLRIA